jgi:hypothetical protein
MTEAREVGASPSTSLKAEPGLLEQYGCGPIRFSGTNDGLYERHLLFDDVVAPSAATGRPSTVIGVPFDRPVVGYGGKNINTLRLWAAAAPNYFDFQEFSSGDFVAALAGRLAAESLTRVPYPNDSTSMGHELPAAHRRWSNRPNSPARGAHRMETLRLEPISLPPRQ